MSDDLSRRTLLAGAAAAAVGVLGPLPHAWAGPKLPVVVTGPATAITETTLTLNGTVNPRRRATMARFEWGTTTAYGNSTPDVSVGSGNAAVPVSTTLTGLVPDTVYHFRLWATSSAGSAVGMNTVARTRLLTQPPAGEQSAVALTAIDGEYISGSTQSNFIDDGFYTRNGLTRAADWPGTNPLGGSFVGFDDPNFVPIAVWLADFAGAGFYSRMDDLGITGMFPPAGSVDLDDVATFGKWVAVGGGEYPNGTLTAGQDPYVIGVLVGDEPSDAATYEAWVDEAHDWLDHVTDGPGRQRHLNYADNLLNGDIENVYTTTDMVYGITDAHPSGIPPQWTACDQYWFAGAPNDAGGSRFKLSFRLYQTAPGSPFNAAQTARGSHYGSMMDCIRKAYTSDVNPFLVAIENGAPYTEPESAAITPAQLKWAVWSTFVHGATGVIYFNHTFRETDPLAGHNNFNNNGYGGPGVAGTGIYAAAEEIGSFILELASVINSPFDGYLCFGDGSASFESIGFLTACTSTNARNYFAGVDASCHWQPTEGKHYIFATTREEDGTTNWPVTFRMVDQGQTTATDLVTGTPITIERGGAIPVGFCEFDDTFATAASYKAYRID
jgi:hypothetical protein